MIFKAVGNWFLAVGILLSLSGLLFLPAACNAHGSGDENLLGAGLAIFGIGALVAASGLYAKARSLKAEMISDPNLPTMPNVKRKDACDLCHKSAPVIACTMHETNLCSNCLVEHFEPLACVYVPAVRKSGGRMVRASFASRG